MARIFEALEQVNLEQTGHPTIVAFPEAARNEYEDRLKAKMHELYRMMCANSTGQVARAFQFIPVQPGAGASRLARTFAKVSAESLGKSVLLVDGSRMAMHFSDFEVAVPGTWVDALKCGFSPNRFIQKTECADLRLLRAFPDTDSISALLQSSVLQEQMDDLRKLFDVVLIDAAITDISPAGLAFVGIVDGSILVLEAERTRWQVAKALIETIESRAGTVIGVVLNGLRFHIPTAIYERL